MPIDFFQNPNGGLTEAELLGAGLQNRNVGVDISAGNFGQAGSHAAYTPSGLNSVGNQGQWWQQAEQDELARQQKIGQVLANRPPPPPPAVDDLGPPPPLQGRANYYVPYTGGDGGQGGGEPILDAWGRDISNEGKPYSDPYTGAGGGYGVYTGADY
jgi:hypothetical protein